MPARWKIKAAVQRVLSVVPLGERANYVLQRRLGGLPISNAELNAARTTVRGHIAAYERHGTRALADASFFEFGAGFDLHMPLIFWTLGVTRQTVVDIVPRARPALVHDAADRLRADESAASPRLTPKGDVGLIEYLLEHGITYRAPADARATGLDASSVDCVTSTSTLEHIPVDDIIRIVGECRRIIRPDGVMSSFIDYQDHYSYLRPFRFRLQLPEIHRCTMAAVQQRPPVPESSASFRLLPSLRNGGLASCRSGSPRS